MRRRSWAITSDLQAIFNTGVNPRCYRAHDIGRDHAMAEAAPLIADREDRSEFLRVDALEHWLAPEALSFWERRPADGLKVGRDVPSRAIAHLLNRVILYEPVDDGHDLKVRLAGTVTRRRFECDITGKKMSALFEPDKFPIRFGVVMEAIKDNAPKMVRITHGLKDFELLRFELLILPVIAPNGRDRWALTFCFYF